MEEIIKYIKYLIKYFQLKPIESDSVLFISHNTALKELREKEFSYYKLYPVEKFLLPIKIRIDKIKYDRKNIKYFYSIWIGHKMIENREHLKYKYENLDEILELGKSVIKTQKNYHYSLLNLLNYNELENLLLETDDVYIQEYIIDNIFKLHSNKLFNLIDIIFSNKFSSHIQQYYKKVIKKLFDFTNYDELTIYYQKLENTFNDNSEMKQLKLELLEIIQEKNLFEVNTNLF